MGKRTNALRTEPLAAVSIARQIIARQIGLCWVLSNQTASTVIRVICRSLNGAAVHSSTTKQWVAGDFLSSNGLTDKIIYNIM